MRPGERLGGRVVLQTQSGTGTTIGLYLPFSLMVTRVMTVEVAGQAFGLPLDTVLETTIIDRDRWQGLARLCQHRLDLQAQAEHRCAEKALRRRTPRGQPHTLTPHHITPSLKVRRAQVAKDFAAEIESLYS